MVLGPGGLDEFLCRPGAGGILEDSREKANIDVRHTDDDAATVGRVAVRPGRPTDEWLFPDAAGDGKLPGHLKDHGIRARRSPGKKRAGHTHLEQISLFGSDVVGAVSR